MAARGDRAFPADLTHRGFLPPGLARPVRSWPAYPAYKPSGVEWLGDIPAHWEVKPLKRVTACLDGCRIPLNGEERAHKQGIYPYWGANSIVDHINDWLFDEDLVLLGEDGAPFFDSTKEVAFFVTGKCWVNNHAHVLRPLRDVDPGFLANCLNGVDYSFFVDGSTRDKLTQSKMSLISIQYPPVDEQRAIAAFLDCETAKLDALIAKHERLIELLQEKRAALISHAVTKGLDGLNSAQSRSDPSVWNKIRLGRVIKLQRGFDITGASEETEGVPVISSGGFSGYCDTAMVEGPGVIVGRKGTLGTVYYVDSAYWPHDTTLWVKEFRGNYPRFVYYYLIHLRLETFDVGAANPTLNRNHVHPLLVTWPDLAAQQSIANFLDRETSKLDTLIACVRDGIEKLREYRAALISAAVTGKIDVRDHQNLQGSAAEDQAQPAVARG